MLFALQIIPSGMHYVFLSKFPRLRQIVKTPKRFSYIIVLWTYLITHYSDDMDFGNKNHSLFRPLFESLFRSLFRSLALQVTHSSGHLDSNWNEIYHSNCANCPIYLSFSRLIEIILVFHSWSILRTMLWAESDSKSKIITIIAYPSVQLINQRCYS